MLELLETKRLEDVSVRDIMDRCDGNRQTFYRHFHDKYELANWIYAEKIKAIMDLYGTELTWFECIERMHQVMFDYRTLYARIESIPDFTNYAFEISVDFIAKTVEARGQDMSGIGNLDEVIAFYCIGARGATQRLIAGGMKASPADMAQIYVDSLPTCLRFLAE